ncbi:MAG: hypothetical protein WBB37_05270 [bacterium]
MGILVLFLLQLWNQPSVRLLGLGGDLNGFLSDPITDVTWNPAYLKLFGIKDNSNDALQLHSKMRSFGSSNLNKNGSFSQFYENDELMALTILYPKIGLGWRIGAWQRYDDRTYASGDRFAYDHLFPQLWLYGQQGMLLTTSVGKWMNVGIEYNFSWNNRTDLYHYLTHDALGSTEIARILHLEWSNEVGIGILLHNNNWEVSLAGKNNWESNQYKMDTTHFWREGEPTKYESYYQDLQINALVRYRVDRINLIGRVTIFRKDINAWHPDFYDKSDYYRLALRPGLGTSVSLLENVSITAAAIYGEKRTDTGIYERGLTIPVGFEYFHNKHIAFRFGNTFNYAYDCHAYHSIWNQLNIGVEIDPYEKLKLHFASQFSDKYTQYLFGLFYSL